MARTPHFALHRLALTPVAASVALELAPGPNDAGTRLEDGMDGPSKRSSAAAAKRASAVALIAPGAVWLGAMVPKRWARRAVTRSAIKRQIYGVGATFEARLPAAAHVVRLRATFDKKQFVSASSALLKTAVREELHALFERASQSAAQ